MSKSGAGLADECNTERAEVASNEKLFEERKRHLGLISKDEKVHCEFLRRLLVSNLDDAKIWGTDSFKRRGLELFHTRYLRLRV
jgi:hypothetical protein